MSKLPLFKPQFTPKYKPISIHPWERTIKDKYSHEINHAHNSIHNPRFPEKAKAKLLGNRIKFTVIGNRCTKGFIYCVRLVQGIHKYRSKVFEVPVIRGVTGVDWPLVWNDLKINYGGMAYCLLSQVAVLIDDQVLGGENELKELIESKYIYHLCLDYYKEAILQFTKLVNLSGRPCVYMQISVGDELIGTMIFTLYADVVPRTCENFLRLCKSTRGGYGGTPIHRIVKDGWIQGGGYALKSTSLNCESFAVPHDRRGVICMANDGRDVDCSTQFFVLLQPALWMTSKYVAFGQLIEGANVLKRLENEPTFYESPVNSINISKTGILNLDCHDIIINKHTNHYINKHIDDLVTVGEMFYALLLERVFLEIEFREIARMEQVGEGEFRVEDEHEPPEMHDSKRFIRNKADLWSRADSVKPEESEDANQDFDVEDYVPEDYSSKKASVLTTATLSVKPTKPFYLPLTDVPYPGEIDSTYDLKKFLRGDYCHESDLGEVVIRKKIALGVNESLQSAEFKLSDNELGYNSSDLDEDDQEEINTYLRNNINRISFAGGVVKSIGRGIGMVNLFENARKSELISFNDEDLRRLRKISVSVPDYERRISHVQNVIRRQSVAIEKQEELEKNEGQEDDEKYERVDMRNRAISIQMPKEDVNKEIKRRQTAFVEQDDLAQIRVFEKGVLIDDQKDDGGDEEGDRKVRIAASTMVPEAARFKRRPTGYVRPGDIPDDDDDDDILAKVQQYQESQRTSSLPWVKTDKRVSANKNEGPTLKDYQPQTATQQKNWLLRGPKFAKEKETYNVAEKSKYLRPSLTVEDAELYLASNLNGNKFHTNEDSNETRPHADSLRTYEYGKSRPSISVSEYKKRNQILAAFNKEKKDRKPKIQVVKEAESNEVPTILRMPGDSPLWSSDSTLSDVVTVFTRRTIEDTNKSITPKLSTVLKLDTQK